MVLQWKYYKITYPQGEVPMKLKELSCFICFKTESTSNGSNLKAVYPPHCLSL